MDISQSPEVDGLLEHAIILLHGEEEVAIQRFLQQILADSQMAGMADLNLSRLDGQTISKADLYNHLHLYPLGSEKRLVILENALTQIKTTQDQMDFIHLLNSLPPTTQLVLVIPDEWRRTQSKWDWQVMSKNSWLTEWLQANEQKAALLEYRLPSPLEMADWIKVEVERQGGTIEQSACRALAVDLGSETRLASQEIEKLLIYTERRRPITIKDVHELCVPLEREDIFAMTDAIAQGNAHLALRLLDISLNNQPEAVILTMIVGHFRQLIIVFEMYAEGLSSEQIGRELIKPASVAQKLVQQSQRFTMARLEEIYQRLEELDEQIKDSRIPPDLALQLFVAELARK